MSDTGLFSGAFQQLRRYAELVDSLLISFKEESNLQNEDSCREIGKLMIDVANREYNDATTRLIVLLLSHRDDVTKLEISRVGKTLVSGKADSTVIEPLEEFAVALEEEQVAAMARLRGATR